MSSSIHVLHIVSGDTWGGAESQLLGLLSFFKSNADVRVTAILLNRGLLSKRLSELDINFEVVDEVAHGPIRLSRKLARKIDCIDPDIVHTHGYKQNIIGAIGARIAGGRICVRTQHGNWEIDGGILSKSTLLRWLDLLTARWLQHKVVAVSAELAEKQSLLLPPCKVEKIENAIDLHSLSVSEASLSQTTQNSPYSIGFVGRLVPVKRIDLFLEAAKLVVQKSTGNIQFDVYGDGAQLDESKVLAARLGISDRVHFRGFVTDISRHLAKLDLLVMTSDHEGLPMTLLEALALEVPVVAPSVGGIPNVLLPEFGSLVDRQDPTAYCDAILEHFNKRDLYRKNLRNAPAFIAERFSMARQGEKYILMYQELINQHQAL
jgi:glycosyltransferase involved in cell wall biosynthesis